MPLLLLAAVLAVSATASSTPLQQPEESSRELLFGGALAAMPPERVATLVAEFAALGAREACYAEAALALQRLCADLEPDEEDLAQLALALFRCRLQNDGRAVPGCLESALLGARGSWWGAAQTVAACTRTLSEEQYQQYLTVAAQATGVCLHYQQRAWRAAAQQTVDALEQTATATLKSLGALQTAHAELADSVDTTLGRAATHIAAVAAGQEQLHASLHTAATSLTSKLDASLAGARDLAQLAHDTATSVGAVRASVTAHAEAASGAFAELRSYADQILALEAAVLRRIGDAAAVLYYLGAVAAAVAATATRATARARLWALGILMLAWAAERAVADDMLAWLVRRAGAAAAAGIVLAAYTRYRDYARLSFDALERIEAALLLARHTPERHQPAVEGRQIAPRLAFSDLPRAVEEYLARAEFKE